MQNDDAAPNPIGTFENDTTTTSEGLSDDTMREEMSARYDSMNGLEAKAAEFVAQPPMPVYKGPEKRGMADTMSDAYDWIHKSADEKFWDAAADKAVDNLKASAEKAGLTPEHYDNLLQRGQPQQPPAEWQTFNEKASRIAPDHKPHELAAEYADLHETFQRDPQAFLQKVADNANIPISFGNSEPLQQYQQIADRYSETMRGVPPAQAFEKLAAANDFLERQPVEGIRWLMQAYNVDVNQLAGAQFEAPKPRPASQRNYKPGEGLAARMRAIYPQAAAR